MIGVLKMSWWIWNLAWTFMSAFIFSGLKNLICELKIRFLRFLLLFFVLCTLWWKVRSKLHCLVSHRMRKVTSQSPKMNISRKLRERRGGAGRRGREEDFCVTCFLIAQSSSYSACQDKCIYTTARVSVCVTTSLQSNQICSPTSVSVWFCELGCHREEREKKNPKVVFIP